MQSLLVLVFVGTKDKSEQQKAKKVQMEAKLYTNDGGNVVRQQHQALKAVKDGKL